MNSVDQQKEHFENISEKYFNARRHTNHLHLKKLLWSFFFRDKDYLKDKVKSVLEPMCGYSEGRNILQNHLHSDFHYDGFDYSDNLVEKARKINPGLNIFVQDVTTYQPERTYDLIVVIGGLHHVYRQVDKSLENLSAALSQGGYFINFEPTNNNFIFTKIRDKIYKNNNIFDQDTERAFEVNQYNNMFKNKGFKLIDQCYPGLLSYILYYNPDAFPKLNIGNARTVETLFKLDSMFYRNFPGRYLSFATLSIWKKE